MALVVGVGIPLQNLLRRHVLVFETSALASAPRVGSVVANLEPEELEGIDLLLLVDGDSVIQCHPLPAVIPRTDT